MPRPSLIQSMLRCIGLSLCAACIHIAPAGADEALAKARNCLGCHAIDRKLVGPAFSQVAQRYAGQDMTEKLAAKIRSGGAGAWGPVPMPANAQVSMAESRQLAGWILRLK